MKASDFETISRTANRDQARRELAYELVSGASGLILALFMWGHMVLVGSILTGERGFDWLASLLEDYYIAQPTVLAIFALFLIHAVFASRKIPCRRTRHPWRCESHHRLKRFLSHHVPGSAIRSVGVRLTGD